MVDVAAADLDVAERPPARADALGGDPGEGEGAGEPGQQVEEHGLAAAGRVVAGASDADGVEAGRAGDLERLGRRRGDAVPDPLGPGDPAAEPADELAGED